MASVSSGLQLRSLVKSDGTLELSLVDTPVPEPAADEIVVRVEAAPINPSDLGLLLGPVDVSTLTQSAPGVVTGKVPAPALRALATRLDQSMPAGNEGAGVVEKAGNSNEAQALLGKTVGLFGGSMYAHYRVAKASEALVLPPGTTAAEGASWFVNPMTVLGMIGTMRKEGHTALVHTAAASNLGQMLVKLCLAEKIPLVNIVRTEQQVQLLKSIGATHVVNSSAPSYEVDLLAAVSATGATLAYDAIGGGRQAGQILAAMEQAANARATTYSRYGSSVHKQVYNYGSLDTRPTEIVRSFGLAWGLGGWLLLHYLAKISNEERQQMRERVARELKTTFASHYTKVISLQEALELPAVLAYNARATGEKYLISPHK